MLEQVPNRRTQTQLREPLLPLVHQSSSYIPIFKDDKIIHNAAQSINSPVPLPLPHLLPDYLDTEIRAFNNVQMHFPNRSHDLNPTLATSLFDVCHDLSLMNTRNTRRPPKRKPEFYVHHEQPVLARQIALTADRQRVLFGSTKVHVERDPDPQRPAGPENLMSVSFDGYDDVPLGFSDGGEGLEGVDVIATSATRYENSVS